MTVADATPDYEVGTSDEDRAFLGHPKGLGYLGFAEACERFKPVCVPANEENFDRLGRHLG